MAYTGDAQPGMTSATAYGYVAPQGENTFWTFIYGTSSSSYGSESKVGEVPAGAVADLVAAPLVRLKAGTTYHYRLYAVPVDSAGNPDWQHASVGQDKTFTTNRGSVNLLASKLQVRSGSVSVPVQCASTLNCSGTIYLDGRGRVGKRVRTVRCASAPLKLVAQARATLRAKLSSACSALIRSARGHRVSARATGRMSSGQTAPDETVTLSR
jgi:hypothetical protein